jgi:hypothetical protein
MVDGRWSMVSVKNWKEAIRERMCSYSIACTVGEGSSLVGRYRSDHVVLSSVSQPRHDTVCYALKARPVASCYTVPAKQVVSRLALDTARDTRVAATSPTHEESMQRGNRRRRRRRRQICRGQPRGDDGTGALEQALARHDA